MNLYSTTSPGARLTVAAQRGLLDVYDEALRATAELVSQLPSAETSPELVRGMVSTPSFLDRMVSRVFAVEATEKEGGEEGTRYLHLDRGSVRGRDELVESDDDRGGGTATSRRRRRLG